MAACNSLLQFSMFTETHAPAAPANNQGSMSTQPCRCHVTARLPSLGSRAGRGPSIGDALSSLTIIQWSTLAGLVNAKHPLDM